MYICRGKKEKGMKGLAGTSRRGIVPPSGILGKLGAVWRGFFTLIIPWWSRADEASEPSPWAAHWGREEGACGAREGP